MRKSGSEIIESIEKFITNENGSINSNKLAELLFLNLSKIDNAWYEKHGENLLD